MENAATLLTSVAATLSAWPEMSQPSVLPTGQTREFATDIIWTVATSRTGPAPSMNLSSGRSGGINTVTGLPMKATMMGKVLVLHRVISSKVRDHRHRSTIITIRLTTTPMLLTTTKRSTGKEVITECRHLSNLTHLRITAIEVLRTCKVSTKDHRRVSLCPFPAERILGDPTGARTCNKARASEEELGEPQMAPWWSILGKVEALSQALMDSERADSELLTIRIIDAKPSRIYPFL